MYPTMASCNLPLLDCVLLFYILELYLSLGYEHNDIQPYRKKDKPHP